MLVFCPTRDMLADIGTKPLNVKQFEYLRDSANGYALCRTMRPKVQIRNLVTGATSTENGAVGAIAVTGRVVRKTATITL